ncbi:hypothetical protein ABLO16_00900 [Mycobacterium tuberculosis]
MPQASSIVMPGRTSYLPYAIGDAAPEAEVDGSAETFEKTSR